MHTLDKEIWVSRARRGKSHERQGRVDREQSGTVGGASYERETTGPMRMGNSGDWLG